MRYEEAAEYILNIPRFTKKNPVEHTQDLLSHLGNPQERRKIIHVAGTNGKGSVCAYLNAMLLAQGKTVGMFVSPHLIKLNERIVINGRQISDKEFLGSFGHMKKKTEEMETEGLPHATFFEFLFGMAMTAFDKEDVEYIVLETGMGGRLDATNSIQRPLATVITSIGLDHMEILGDSVEKIASEKAGIIKKEVPVFYANTCQRTNQMIEKRAEELGAPCKKIGKDAYEILGIRDKHIAFSSVNAYYGNTTWTLNNIGLYQPDNAMLAMEVMGFIFGNTGCVDSWREALSTLKWEGRMEEVLPHVYVDGAHNVSAVEGFVQSMKFRHERNIVLFSTVQDKDYKEMAACLCKKLDTDFYIITLIESSRSVNPEELKHIFEAYTDKPVFVKESLEEALDLALKEQKGRSIYCLGSLYLAGMMKSLIPTLAI